MTLAAPPSTVRHHEGENKIDFLPVDFSSNPQALAGRRDVRESIVGQESERKSPLTGLGGLSDMPFPRVRTRFHSVYGQDVFMEQEWIEISDSSTTTIISPFSMDLKNGREKLKEMVLHLVEDIRPEMKDDPTYQDEVGPPPKHEYVWRNIIIIPLLHLGALYGITLVPGCKVYTWLWVLLCYVVSGLGITAGAHRLWSHRTYKARLPLRLFLIIANTMAFQNDVYEWARDHRVHHKFTETHADPHNSRRGFFFSHVGWLFVRKHPAVREKGGLLDLSDLKAEKLLMFQRRYYKPSVLLMCFILPTLVPWYCWGETFRHSLYVAAFLRCVVALNMTWMVNSVAHLYGYRPYDKNIEARENVLLSLGALGEGFHNYHHTFPYDYSTSEYHWSLNFTTFFIDCMAAIGLAYHLKKVPKASILARIKRTGDGSYKSG
ncbi:acyl-CoA desaturase 1-like [Dipodomys spectabilis]|uniref:acyl-CoA desaturase 1-like n=1 Tax=Dipodomys spectabilis TaxID=105255 RepID=UPI001C53BE73|nr:acyl-CoA desaturase 1-like [Dipodomys spectabilis]